MLSYVIAVLFPRILTLTPDGGATGNGVAFVALAIFLGQMVQALGSLIEPVLYKSWGGRPSEKALDGGLGERYLPEHTALRIRTKLESAAGEDAGLRDMFFVAKRRAEQAESKWVSTLNASFAYHRALVVLVLIVGILSGFSMCYGTLSSLSGWSIVGFFVLTLAATVLFWHRCRQRAYYYVREVYLVAERSFDAPDKSQAS